MAFSIVRVLQSDQIVSGAASTASFAVTAGNQLIAGVAWAHTTDNTITISSLVCNGQNFTLIGSPQRGAYSSNQEGIQLAYLQNVASSGPVSVDLTMSSSSFSLTGSFFILEVSGGDTASFASANQAANGTSSTPSLSITTASANEMIVGVIGASGSAGGEPTPGATYTAIPLVDAGGYNTGEYKLDAGAAGAKTVDFSLAASTFWMLSAASFKLAGAGPLSKYQDITLVDEAGAPLANLTGLQVYGWDSNVPSDVFSLTPVDYSATGTTNGSGLLRFDRPNTTLAAGNVSFVLVSQSNGSVSQSPAPRSFFGPVAISSS